MFSLVEADLTNRSNSWYLVELFGRIRIITVRPKWLLIAQNTRVGAGWENRQSASGSVIQKTSQPERRYYVTIGAKTDQECLHAPRSTCYYYCYYNTYVSRTCSPYPKHTLVQSTTTPTNNVPFKIHRSPPPSPVAPQPSDCCQVHLHLLHRTYY